MRTCTLNYFKKFLENMGKFQFCLLNKNVNKYILSNLINESTLKFKFKVYNFKNNFKKLEIVFFFFSVNASS